VIGEELYLRLLEDIETLDSLVSPPDPERISVRGTSRTYDVLMCCAAGCLVMYIVVCGLTVLWSDDDDVH
jgi:hypothetical protein